MYSEQTKATLLKDVTAIVKSKADHVEEIKSLKHVDLQQSITDVSTQNYYNIQDYCNIQDYFVGSFFTGYSKVQYSL